MKILKSLPSLENIKKGKQSQGYLYSLEQTFTSPQNQMCFFLTSQYFNFSFQERKKEYKI